MSINYHAYVVLGICVLKKEMHRISSRRGCDHAQTDKKFCAECGKSMWEDDSEEVKLPEGVGTFSSNWDDEEVVLGQRIAEVPDYGIKQIPISPERIETAKEGLRKLSIYRESRFGVWLVLYCG